MTTDIFNAGTPVYPDMAVNTDGTDNDVTDATSGQLNVVAASGAKQLAGWGYTEKPARNVMNWIHRLTTQWIRWLYSNAWHADTVFYGSGSDSGSSPTKVSLSSIHTGLTISNCMIVSVMQNTPLTNVNANCASLCSLQTITAVDYLMIPWAVGASPNIYKYIVKKTS